MKPPRSFRFGERRSVDGAEAPATALRVTAEDERNIAVFATQVEETVQLLRAEIEAIKEGRLSDVSAMFERKSEAIKRLELQSPLVEPFLQHEVAEKRGLANLLTELKTCIEEDAALLGRMAVAAKTVRREIEKVTNRNSLGGTYGVTGKKRGASADTELSLDQKL
jgi:hypothetical protein